VTQSAFGSEDPSSTYPAQEIRFSCPSVRPSFDWAFRSGGLKPDEEGALESANIPQALTSSRAQPTAAALRDLFGRIGKLHGVGKWEEKGVKL
jgi:hypothetical protein